MGINDRAREFGDGPLERIDDIQEKPERVRPIDKLLKRKDIPKHDQLVMEKIDVNREFVLPSERIEKIDDKLNDVLRRLDNMNKNIIDITNIVERFRQVMDE